MKKVIIFLVLLVCFSLGCSEAFEKPRNPSILYCAGDSLMVGMQGEILNKMHPIIKTVKLAVGGTSTKTVVLPRNLKEGDIVLLSLGTNDIMGKIQEKDVRKIIETAQRAKCELVWVLPPHFLRQSFENRLSKTSDFISKICKEEHIKIIDLRNAPKETIEMRANDGIHYTRKGYSLLAEYVVEQL